MVDIRTGSIPVLTTKINKMEKNLKEIKHVIEYVCKTKRLDAGFSGSHGDNGASRLERDLAFFIMGVEATEPLLDGMVDDEDLFKVPTQWEGYFKESDPEYSEYLRLKEKFG